jgi:hypothetical protein
MKAGEKLSQSQEQRLQSLLQSKVDELTMSGLGLAKITARLGAGPNRRARRVLLPVAAAFTAVLAVGGGIAFVVHGHSPSANPVAAPHGGVRPSDAYPIVWPASSAAKGPAKAWSQDPGLAAQEFLKELSVPTAGLAFTPQQSANDGLRTLKVATNRGLVLGEVHLKYDSQRSVWGVQSMDSPRVVVRNPQPVAVINPPLSVSFKSDMDGYAQVQLFDARSNKELTKWQEQIDPSIDWQANANFTREDKPFPGYLVLTVSDDAHQVGGLVVMPLSIGTS